ncbi:hypothetical protein E1N66_19395 [Pantoea allii]|nr:H-NS family nucleoid-associated regulatory protein [Pantoea allii]THB82737.1 hypothetical protein E1N66_19395 [Pantoea allii]
MSLIDQLNNIRTIRKEARETSFEVFHEVLEKLNTVFQEISEEHEQKAKEIEKRAEVLNQIREMMIAEGITDVDLVDRFANPNAAPATDKPARGPKKGSKRAPVEPKYEYELNGETKTWTGQGRTPKPIASALEEGKKLEDFLIKK